MATEKERGRYAHVLMNSHVLLLKHLNNLFEAKLWLCLFLFALFFRGFGDGLYAPQLT